MTLVLREPTRRRRAEHRVTRLPVRWNEFLACAIVFIAFAIPNRYAIGAQGFTLDIPTLLGVLAALFWFISTLCGFVTVERLNPVRTALIVLTLYALLSAATAYARNLSVDEGRGALRAVADSVGMLGVALLVLDGLRTRESLARLAAWAVAGGSLSAAVAVGQKLFGFGYAAWWGSVPLLTQASTTAPLEGLVSGRALGTANHPIELSVASAALVPLAVAGAGYVTTRTTRRWFLGATGLLTVGAFLAVSRSGFIALVIVGLLILNRTPPRQRLNIVAGLAFIFAALQVLAHGTLSTLRYQLEHIGEDNSSKGRTADYGPVLDLVRQGPWFGRGLGTYIPDQYRYLDNAWLGQLVGGGIVGVVVLAVTVLTGLYTAGTVTHEGTDPVVVGIVRAAGYAVVALAVAAYFFDELSFAQTQLLLFVSLAIIGAGWGILRAPERQGVGAAE